MGRIVINNSNMTYSSLKRDSIADSTINSIEDYFINNKLKKKIIEILLEDPDSEVMKITENYLIQCLYDATNDPENNPILYQFFEKDRQDRLNLNNQLTEIKRELKELKELLGIENYSSSSFTRYPIASWKAELDNRCYSIEYKLKNITEKLEKTGINISYR